MAIKNTSFGGTDWVLGEKLDADDLNDTFDSTIKAIAPIGGIIAWNKTMTSVPALPINWLECDGSTISNALSPMDGENLPDLNGDNRFLRGNSTSESTGGSETSEDENRPPFFDVVWVMRIY